MSDMDLGGIDLSSTNMVIELSGIILCPIYAKFALLASFKNDFNLLPWDRLIKDFEDPQKFIDEITSTHPIIALKAYYGTSETLTEEKYVEYKNTFDSIYDKHKGDLVDLSPMLNTISILSNLIIHNSLNSITCVACDPYTKEDAEIALATLVGRGCSIQCVEAESLKSWCIDNADRLHDFHRIYSSSVEVLHTIDKIWNSSKECNMSIHIPDTKYNHTNIAEEYLRQHALPATAINLPELKIYKTRYLK